MSITALPNELLKWKMLPARLTQEKVAEILGFSPYEISVLMGIGLLKPLGKPAPNAHKYFCASEILELSYNREWLDKVTRLISKHWQDKNRREKEQKLAASSILIHS
jgi:hypothetical protein